MAYTNALQTSWAALKENMPNRPEAKLHFVETENAYYVLLSDKLFELSTIIEKEAPEGSVEAAALSDFEQNFKATANTASPMSEVVTQFEKNDKRLKLASAQGTFDENGLAVLTIRIPEGGRHIAGGWAVTDVFNFGDKLTKVQVVDDLDLTGQGTGTVLAMYQDQDVPEENCGWLFWPEPGNRGGCEIEPIGGYGFLPEGFLFEMHVKKTEQSTASKVLINLWWAKTE